jgi:hypothetical protein
MRPSPSSSERKEMKLIRENLLDDKDHHAFFDSLCIDTLEELRQYVRERRANMSFDIAEILKDE